MDLLCQLSVGCRDRVFVVALCPADILGCSSYEKWLLRMNTRNNTASTAAQKLMLSATDAKNESAFNNIVFCELEEAMLKKEGKEIGSAKVGDSFNIL